MKLKNKSEVIFMICLSLILVVLIVQGLSTYTKKQQYLKNLEKVVESRQRELKRMNEQIDQIILKTEINRICRQAREDERLSDQKKY